MLGNRWLSAVGTAKQTSIHRLCLFLLRPGAITKNARKNEAINARKKNRKVFLVINIPWIFSERQLFFLICRTTILAVSLERMMGYFFHFSDGNLHLVFSPMCRFEPFDDAHWPSKVYPSGEPAQGEEKKSNQPDEDDNVEIGLVPTRQTHLVIRERYDTNECLPSPFKIVRFFPLLSRFALFIVFPSSSHKGIDGCTQTSSRC